MTLKLSVENAQRVWAYHGLVAHDKVDSEAAVVKPSCQSTSTEGIKIKWKVKKDLLLGYSPEAELPSRTHIPSVHVGIHDAIYLSWSS